MAMLDENEQPLKLMDESFGFVEGIDEDGAGGGDEQEVDPVSKVLLTRFEEAPIPPEGVDNWTKSSRILKFRLNPNGVDGVGFISQNPHSDKRIKVYPQETKIYTTKVPTFDDADAYVEYVSNLYSIYDALGEEKYYSVPTAGVINREAQRNQINVLTKAMSLTIEELQSYIDKKSTNANSEIEVFELEEILAVLNCLRALYFTPDNEIPRALAQWINMADPQPDAELANGIMKSEIPYKHPLFWAFITQLTLRGLYETASDAFKQSKFEELHDDDEELYNLIVDCLHLLESYPENSPQEIFKTWKSTAAKALSNASLRNTDNPMLLNNIRKLLQILAGDQTAIVEQSTSWYEALVGLVYYHIPSSELLTDYFNSAVSSHKPDQTSIWELACVDIFEESFLQALRAISSFSTATSAYVSALCEARGLLKGYSFDDDFKVSSSLLISQDLFSTTNPSEFLIHTHALDCLTIHELAPVGIGLLAPSRNPTARSVIAEYLPRYEFQNNDDIEWALTVCASLKLPYIAHVIYRTAAQRSLAEGLLLEALKLFARAGEIEYVKHHCWLIFENSLMRGEPIQDVIINATVDDSISIEGVDRESLELTPLLRQTLAPYAILYRFWNLKKEGSLRLALKKLISLLKFPYLPPRLFGLVLSQLLPFVILLVPPKVLLKEDLLTVVKILDKYEEDIFNKKDKKSIVLTQECDELYRASISQEFENDSTYWTKYLDDANVKPPHDLQTLLKVVRRNVAVEIGRAYLEDSYN